MVSCIISAITDTIGTKSGMADTLVVVLAKTGSLHFWVTRLNRVTQM
jgi:hypothetical protein